MPPPRNSPPTSSSRTLPILGIGAFGLVSLLAAYQIMKEVAPEVKKPPPPLQAPSPTPLPSPSLLPKAKTPSPKTITPKKTPAMVQTELEALIQNIAMKTGREATPQEKLASLKAKSPPPVEAIGTPFLLLHPDVTEVAEMLGISEEKKQPSPKKSAKKVSYFNQIDNGKEDSVFGLIYSPKEYVKPKKTTISPQTVILRFRPRLQRGADIGKTYQDIIDLPLDIQDPKEYVKLLQQITQYIKKHDFTCLVIAAYDPHSGNVAQNALRQAFLNYLDIWMLVYIWNKHHHLYDSLEHHDVEEFPFRDRLAHKEDLEEADFTNYANELRQEGGLALLEEQKGRLKKLVTKTGPGQALVNQLVQDVHVLLAAAAAQ